MPFGGLFGRLMGGAGVPTIDHAEMTRAVASKSCCIVDVREPHEYAAGHIPGAINRPLSRFAPQELPKDKPVILVCQAGGRSAKALQQALHAGCRDIRHYSPGTGGWKSCGGSLVT
jgi:rhodanese-related sulfurtransferase